MRDVRESPGVVGETTTGAEESHVREIQYISSEPPLQALHLDGGARPRGLHAHEDSRANHADKPKLRPRSARSRRARSRYRPGSAYRPPKETLAKCQREVLEVLKKAGPDGVTRLEAPDHLQMSWPQRISELRKKGYRIDSKRDWVDKARFARYVLVAPEPVSEAGARP